VYIRSAAGVCGRPAGWRVLADRARLGRSGSRLLLCASVAGLFGGISWWPPAYSLFYDVLYSVASIVYLDRVSLKMTRYVIDHNLGKC